MTVNEKQLKIAIDRMNQLAEQNKETYTNGKSNPDNYHLSCAYGGYAVYQITNESGGCTDVFKIGHVSKAALFNSVHAWLAGYQDCLDTFRKETVK